MEYESVTQKVLFDNGTYCIDMWKKILRQIL
jgi:hypothetical protein